MRRLATRSYSVRIIDKGYAALSKFLTTQKHPPSESFKLNCQLVLTNFTAIASSPTLKFPFEDVSRVAPVEISMICQFHVVFDPRFSKLTCCFSSGVLIHRMRARPLAEIAEAIDEMRKDVRVKHVDVRNNSRIVSSMWEFCKTIEATADTDVGGSRTKRQRGSK